MVPKLPTYVSLCGRMRSGIVNQVAGRGAIRLDFTEFVGDDEGTLAWAFGERGPAAGIYWLDFADGSSYVGQSVALDARLATHRRHWRGEVVTVRVATCPIDRLDEAERSLIADLDKQGRPLRNKALTLHPRGLDDFEVTIRPGVSVRLPWRRADRGRMSQAAVPDPIDEPEAHRRKHAEISALPIYPVLCSTLRAFVDAVIPSPTLTAPVLWTMTALPSTSRAPGWRRLTTVNAGRLEILRVFEDRIGAAASYPVYVNLPSQRLALCRCDHGRRPDPNHRTSREPTADQGPPPGCR